MNEEIRALFKPIYLSTQDLYNHPIINGQFIVDSLTGAEYIDVLGVRTLLTRILFVTYSELLDAQANEDLIPNRFYCITDYRTIYTIDGQTYGRDNDEIQTAVEPLYIKAIDKERLDEANVMSMLYPTDQIVYSLSNTVVNYTDKTYSKGIIISRKDTLNNIYADQDWRNIKLPVMKYNPTASVVDYTPVQMIPAGKLIRGNGVVGTVGSIFTYGKNKIADYGFSIRESDVFETIIDQFIGKNIVVSGELPTYPLYKSDDVKDQVYRSVDNTYLLLNDFEQKSWVNMITATKDSIGKNIKIIGDPMELTNIVLNGHFENVNIEGDNLTVLGEYDHCTITGSASLIDIESCKYSIINADHTSVKSVKCDNSRLHGINSLVNATDGISNSEVSLKGSVINKFINPSNVSSPSTSLVDNSNVLAFESKLNSIKDCNLAANSGVVNSLVKSSKVCDLTNSHVYCPWINILPGEPIIELEFTNPSQSQEGVKFGVRYNKDVTEAIGNINSVYNELVNENKYHFPFLVVRKVEGEDSVWIDFRNQTGIEDTTRIQTVLPYDQKITPVPVKSKNRLNRTIK